MRTYTKELCHHGIKGQKWGVRRYQNKDGSLTEAGKKRKVLIGRENWNARKEIYSYSKDYMKKINDPKAFVHILKHREKAESMLTIF